eukprot:SAG31_NODE_2454_length_5664_cov_4.255885_8_plen_51_part_00
MMRRGCTRVRRRSAVCIFEIICILGFVLLYDTGTPEMDTGHKGLMPGVQP